MTARTAAPSIFPDPMPASRGKALSELVTSVRAELDETLGAAESIAIDHVTPEVVDELIRLHFQGTRLSRRLRALGEEGLTQMSAERMEDIEEIVTSVIAEVRAESQRRHITMEIEIETRIGQVLLDREQIAEALRCLLDDALSGAMAGTTVTISVARKLGKIAFGVSYRQPGVTYSDTMKDRAALQVAWRVVESAGGKMTRKHSGPWSETRFWIPQPTASYDRPVATASNFAQIHAA